MAFYSFVGFAGSFLGPLVFGWMLDRFGGAHSLLAWGFAYGSCGIAALGGGLAMLLVGRDRTTRQASAQDGHSLGPNLRSAKGGNLSPLMPVSGAVRVAAAARNWRPML